MKYSIAGTSIVAPWINQTSSKFVLSCHCVSCLGGLPLKWSWPSTEEQLCQFSISLGVTTGRWGAEKYLPFSRASLALFFEKKKKNFFMSVWGNTDRERERADNKKQFQAFVVRHRQKSWKWGSFSTPVNTTTAKKLDFLLSLSVSPCLAVDGGMNVLYSISRIQAENATLFSGKHERAISVRYKGWEAGRHYKLRVTILPTTKQVDFHSLPDLTINGLPTVAE